MARMSGTPSLPLPLPARAPGAVSRAHAGQLPAVSQPPRPAGWPGVLLTSRAADSPMSCTLRPWVSRRRASGPWDTCPHCPYCSCGGGGARPCPPPMASPVTARPSGAPLLPLPLLWAARAQAPSFFYRLKSNPSAVASPLQPDLLTRKVSGVFPLRRCSPFHFRPSLFCGVTAKL